MCKRFVKAGNTGRSIAGEFIDVGIIFLLAGCGQKSAEKKEAKEDPGVKKIHKAVLNKTYKNTGVAFIALFLPKSCAKKDL